jgi:thioredoxin 1
MAGLIDVTDFSFDAEVLKNDLLVIADFWAEWSAPCKAFEPFLKQLADRHEDLLKVVKVDIESNPVTTSTYQVLTLPTLILFKNGVEVERMDGSQARQTLAKKVEFYLREFAK